MDERYRYETLPLDTPDDDPRWAEYLGIFQLGFLDQRRGEATLDRYRKNKRTDGSTLGMITAEGPGLAHRQPVAAFASAPYRHNAGRGLVPTTVVNTIAVRSSHRRRGLLTEMMRRHLDQAREAGHATAVLSVSEATIYRRFGFGPATRRTSFTIDTRRFRIRDDVSVAEGELEFCRPGDLGEDLYAVARRFDERYLGAHTMQEFHRALASGAWDGQTEGPSQKLWALGHWSGDQLTGYALFAFDAPGQGEKDSSSATVHAVCAPDPAVRRRLYQMLAEIDLVEKLHCFGPGPDESLPLSVVDPWAVKLTEVTDGVWLRVLDLPKAYAERGWACDGELVLGVHDRLGYADGTWRLVVRHGRAEVSATDARADIEMDVSTLGLLHFGDRRVGDCATAGLIAGAPEALVRAHRLFSLPQAPNNLAHF